MLVWLKIFNFSWISIFFSNIERRKLIYLFRTAQAIYIEIFTKGVKVHSTYFVSWDISISEKVDVTRERYNSGAVRVKDTVHILEPTRKHPLTLCKKKYNNIVLVVSEFCVVFQVLLTDRQTDIQTDIFQSWSGGWVTSKYMVIFEFWDQEKYFFTKTNTVESTGKGELMVKAKVKTGNCIV